AARRCGRALRGARSRRARTFPARRSAAGAEPAAPPPARGARSGARRPRPRGGAPPGARGRTRPRRDSGGAPSPGGPRRRARRGAELLLGESECRVLARRPAAARPRRRAKAAEVVLVMGIPGSGKTHAAASFVARGYTRLNRDERGGSLRDVAAALDEELAS